jgi:hypothetical protein
VLESEDLIIEAKDGRRLKPSQLFEANAEHFPIRVRYHFARPEGRRVRADEDKRRALETCMNGIAGSECFDVVSVYENQNDLLLSRYLEFQEHLKRTIGAHYNRSSMRRQPCQMTVKTVSLKGELFHTLDSSVNEEWLFHGTSMDNAANISGSSFSLEHAKVGNFGPGIYFTDDPRKADHHAPAQEEMLQVMLLCRVACGRVKKVPGRGNYRDDVLGPGACVDSIHGVPSQTTRSFDEYIIFNEMQCYPEFLIIYKRKG